jgi:voltage-gated potassium channel
VRFGLTVLAATVLVGTLGYMIIEGASAFDSFYMVLITITSVGFAEVFELSDMGRVWTLVVLGVGFGVALYTAVASIEALVDFSEDRKRRRVQNQVAKLTGHVIVCGFGRVGRGTWHALTNKGVDVVVIESDNERVEAARAADAYVIRGDATHNDVLELAGVHEAIALIACVADDSDNLVIALSVKALTPNLRVICRATEPESERKLRLAGADAVVAPQAVGAERLALLALQPELAQIFDVVVGGRPVEFHVEELDVAPSCSVDGRTIGECGIRQQSGALILAVETPGETTVVNPGADVVLNAGNRLIVVGTKDQVDRASKLLQGV